jgi:cytochrome P450
MKARPSDLPARHAPARASALEDPPLPNLEAGLLALRVLLREKSVLPVLQALHDALGDVFRLPLPGFNAVVLVGPEANRFVHVTARDDLGWRLPSDPITRLLRHGLLVEDGQDHDRLRRLLAPALRRQQASKYTASIIGETDRVTASWEDVSRKEMVTEMRRVALLILMRTVFGVDFAPDMPRLWPSILRLLQYISPGAWLIWPRMPRLGYRRARRQLDDYLYSLIRDRRSSNAPGEDMLSLLVAEPGMDDELIRDQLLTMLIAGHDTCTALLTWALYLMGKHPSVLQRSQTEVDTFLADRTWGASEVESLPLLDVIVRETLRLYPPVHIGMRVATRDLTFRQYRIPAGTRVIYSIYLTHRLAEIWPDSDRFAPDRFQPSSGGPRPSYAYLPFGGGPRNCIGSSFGLLETKIVLARLLQVFEFELLTQDVRPHVGATLEPRPRVIMRVHRRSRSTE